MNRWRRNDANRRRLAEGVLVFAPHAHVGCPWPAQMMRERAAQRQRALIEIVMVMRRDLVALTRTDARNQTIDHEGGATVDSAEPPSPVRHIQRVPLELQTAQRLRPRLEGRNIRMR